MKNADYPREYYPPWYFPPPGWKCPKLESAALPIRELTPEALARLQKMVSDGCLDAVGSRKILRDSYGVTFRKTHLPSWLKRDPNKPKRKPIKLCVTLSKDPSPEWPPNKEAMMADPVWQMFLKINKPRQ